MSATLLAIVPDIAAGLLAGGLHAGMLRKNAALYLQPGRIPAAVAMQVLRLGLLGAVLALLAREGAVALLAGAGGVLAGRHGVLLRLARTMR